MYTSKVGCTEITEPEGAGLTSDGAGYVVAARAGLGTGVAAQEHRRPSGLRHRAPPTGSLFFTIACRAALWIRTCVRPRGSRCRTTEQLAPPAAARIGNYSCRDPRAWLYWEFDKKSRARSAAPRRLRRYTAYPGTVPEVQYQLGTRTYCRYLPGRYLRKGT